VAGKVSRAKAPDHTHKEAEYLRRLIAEAVRVRVRTMGNDEFDGTLAFFDATFLRLTRQGEPNLFFYKQDIKYLIEVPNAPEIPDIG
jgi:host factor-I protein